MHRPWRHAAHLTLWLFIGLLVTGCSSTYLLVQSNGAQSLYRVDERGRKTIIYDVSPDGSVTVHHTGDPMAKRYLSGKQSELRVKDYLDQLESRESANRSQSEKKRKLRIDQIKKARKRSDGDPIFVMVHEPMLGSKMVQHIPNADMAIDRIKRVVSRKISADKTIRVTSQMADVDIFSESYFEESQAFNTHTRKMVTMNAFHFKVAIRSNYLPEDRYTIVESGNWYENERIIQRAAARVRAIIKTRIGPNIPAERYKYL